MEGHEKEHVQLDLFPEVVEERKGPVLQRPRDAGTHLTIDASAMASPSADALAEAMARVLPANPIPIRYTDNRTVILSLRDGGGSMAVLRAHHCFRSAPPSVAEAAVRLYLTPSSRAERRQLTQLVTGWHQHAVTPPESPSASELQFGEHHDLLLVLERVNRAFFDNCLKLDITFGGRIARRLMGRHERRQPKSLVVINPLLDHPWITSWYLDYLVFHECLHEVIPPLVGPKRILLHPPEFQRRERQHPDFARSRPYERWIMGPAWPNLRAAAQQRMVSSRIDATTATRMMPRKSRGRDGPGRADP